MVPHSSPSGFPAASGCEHRVHDTHHREDIWAQKARGWPRFPGKLLGGARPGSAHLIRGSWTPPFPRTCWEFPLFKALPGGSAGSLPPLVTPEALRGLGPAPRTHVTRGQGRRAGPGGSCPGRTSSVGSRLPGSSGPLGMVR